LVVGLYKIHPFLWAKGTPLFASVWSLHRDASVFEANVNHFVPARWKRIQPEQWEYVAFGTGQRSCLGKEKVLAETAFKTARIAKAVPRVENREMKPWQKVVMLTVNNVNSFKVRSTGRIDLV
jgi:cytochrome P450